MAVLYPNLCYNEVCYKGTALYLVSHKGLHCMLFASLFLNLSNFRRCTSNRIT